MRDAAAEPRGSRRFEEVALGAMINGVSRPRRGGGVKTAIEIIRTGLLAGV